MIGLILGKWFIYVLFLCGGFSIPPIQGPCVTVTYLQALISQPLGNWWSDWLNTWKNGSSMCYFSVLVSQYPIQGPHLTVYIFTTLSDPNLLEIGSVIGLILGKWFIYVVFLCAGFSMLHTRTSRSSLHIYNPFGSQTLWNWFNDWFNTWKMVHLCVISLW